MATLSGCVIGDADHGTHSTTDASVTSTTAGPDGGSTVASAPNPTVAAGAASSSAVSPAVSLSTPYSLSYLADGTMVSSGNLGTTVSAPGLVAWSTSKVPLAIAALRAVRDGSSTSDAGSVHSNVTSAITSSDNAAADALWKSLGDPATAGRKVEAVLREGGDSTTKVQTAVTRAGLSSFGQTVWSTADQASFAGKLSCVAESTEVVAAMGQIASGQDYGLGTLPGATFKGGWGPDAAGAYQVRQFGTVPGINNTRIPVAIAVTSPDGSYESGIAALNEIVGQLSGTLSSTKGVDSASC